MKQDWVKVWDCQNQVDALLIQMKMEEVGIEVVVMNQQDSSYGMFGGIQLWVPQGDKHAAEGLLLSLGFDF